MVAFFSCQTNSDTKIVVTNNKNSDKPPIKIAPKFFVGDSVLTLSVKCRLDIDFVSSKNPDFDKYENTTTRKYKDSIIITVHKLLAQSLYSGSCDQKGDTIHMNYWIDTLNCVPMMCPFILTYKIKRTKYSHLKLKYIDNVNMPSDKSCEEMHTAANRT